MLIDTHCHVLSSEYDNPHAIIKECFDNGLDKMIINGFDADSSIEAVELSKIYTNVYASIGIGPDSIDKYNDDTLEIFQDLIDNNRITAIGEIGLDYYWTKENKDKQIYVFKKMLGLALKNNLPVIIHCRDSFLDTYNILKEYKVKGVIHCFTGSFEIAKLFSDLGFVLAIGGVVTFKNAKQIVKTVEKLSLSNIVLETDSPYLSPEPFRGKKNKPYYIASIAKKISEIKGVSIQEVMDATTNNVKSKFDLDI